MLEDLQLLAEIANQEAFRECGHKKTCILTSAALYHAICEIGWGVRPVRLRASVYSLDPKHRHGCILGSDGCGERMPKASEGCWWGHLGVLVHERFLIDATIDQVGEGETWATDVKPFVGEVPDGFVLGAKSLFVEHGSISMSYSMFYRQNGWKSAPDWRNKWNWLPLMRRILDRYDAKSIAKESRVA